MTNAEMVAFNVGVAAVLTLAEASAAAMRDRLVDKPTRYAFAVEALAALAEAGAGLALPLSLPYPKKAAGGPPQGRESAS